MTTIWIVLLVIGVVLSLINSIRAALYGHRMRDSLNTRVIPAMLWISVGLGFLGSALEAAA